MPAAQAAINRRCGMSQFLGRGSIIQVGQVAPVMTEFSVAGRQIELHVPEDGRERNALLSTCLVLMNRTEDPYQASAYLCSALMCYLPNLMETVAGVFRELTYESVVLRTRNQRAEAGLVMSQPSPGNSSLVYFGQAVLVLYKNVQDASYRSFTSKWVAALCASAGVNQVGTPLVVPIEKAKQISRVLGNCFKLRKELLTCLLQTSPLETFAGAVARYVAEILEWTDMTGLRFIHEMLLLSNSPVLRHPFVQLEILHLRESFKLINSSQYPRYYKIIEHPSKTRHTTRANYPIVMAVAHHLKAEQTATSARFVGPLDKNNEVVDMLLRLHRGHLNRIVRVETTAVKFLTDFEDLEVEPEGNVAGEH